MNCQPLLPEQRTERLHRDLYVVNKLGVSCIDKPPYVPYYRWPCPSREEVRENLAELFLEVAERYDVDGLHFDYIRLPDALLPRGLRREYPGVPLEDVVKPVFDYCYCLQGGLSAREGCGPGGDLLRQRPLRRVE